MVIIIIRDAGRLVGGDIILQQASQSGSEGRLKGTLPDP